MRSISRSILAPLLLAAMLVLFSGPVGLAGPVALAAGDAPAVSDETGQADEAHAEPSHGEGDHGGGHHAGLGADLPLWWAIPFAGILLSIAVLPVAAPRFWHAHFPKVSFAWAAVFAVPFLLAFGEDAVYAIVHIYLIDYVPFIILLWGLFTVAGGIVVRGTFRGTPAMNALLLAIGTILASFVGTTGAAMVMIRPVLRANAPRKRKTHILIFFIFLVANIGGSLTPLGDPPLFLGFIHSVPFTWTLIHMPLPMGLLAGMLLVGFFALDSFCYKKDVADGVRFDEETGGGASVSFAGLHNVVFLLGIIGSVLLSGIWHAGEITIIGVHVAIQNIVRDVLIVGCGILSLRTTQRALRRENEFTWGPILEVGYLFAGIFMTIIPALEILKAGQEGALAGLINAVREPWQYFWVTGTLSAFLDNAPTYLTFFNTALGSFFPGLDEPAAVARLIAEQNIYLLAISTGAVFMGACSYIGNAPNFMVKSIAEEAGIAMPSFFGYILRWTLPILVPALLVVTFFFF